MSDSSGAPARSRLLAALTYPEVAAIVGGARPSVAILPVGSTEAHGPHLPLGTDSILSEGMALRGGEALAERGVECVVLPTIHYAITEWARDFTGSMSIAAPVAHDLVLGACAAAKSIGFTRVAMVSAHLEPGHIASLRRVAEEYEAARGEPLIFVDKTRRANAARLGDEFKSGSCHAGAYETSLVMALRPAWVQAGVAAALPRHTVSLVDRIRAGATGFLECGMEQAYCGDPAEASAAEGERLLAILAEMIAEAVIAGLPEAERPKGQV
ncbi:MAG: creatininase family protein [Nannocystaceae bacterium]